MMVNYHPVKRWTKQSKLMEFFNFTFQEGLLIKNNLNKTQRWLLHFHHHHPESLVLKISNRRMIDPNIG
jgi:hypothetical protein